MEEPPAAPFLGRDVPAGRLRRWIHDGLVRRVLRGVYCTSAVADSLELRVACAALVLPADAVVCDRSAAWLWGIEVQDPDERHEVPDLEVAVPPGHEAPRRAGLLGCVRDLATTDITLIAGTPVTTSRRTALDLACRRGRRQALAVLDAFMRTCGLTHSDLTVGLTRFGRRRGVAQVRELVPLASPLAESQGESWTRIVILDAGLPAPRPQFEIIESGKVLFRQDLSYPQWRVAVEYFGEEWHGPDQEEHDRARLEWLEAHGWHVIVVRKHQFKGAALEEWLAELAEVIAERRARPKRRYARRREPWIKR